MMGVFLRLFQKAGSVGSIARWSWKCYQGCRRQFPQLSEQLIAQELWLMRYGNSPPRPRSLEAGRFDEVELSDIGDIEDLCRLIAFVEMNVSPTDGKLFRDVDIVIRSTLKRHGYRRLDSTCKKPPKRITAEALGRLTSGGVEPGAGWTGHDQLLGMRYCCGCGANHEFGADASSVRDLRKMPVQSVLESHCGWLTLVRVRGLLRARGLLELATSRVESDEEQQAFMAGLAERFHRQPR